MVAGPDQVLKHVHVDTVTCSPPQEEGLGYGSLNHLSSLAVCRSMQSVLHWKSLQKPKYINHYKCLYNTDSNTVIVYLIIAYA